MSKTFVIPGCPKVIVELIGEAAGMQISRVHAPRGGIIPLHTHTCAATMVIVSGKALKLDRDGKGTPVGPRDVIIKQEGEPHGFTDIEDDLEFISISSGDGIFQDKKADLKFC